MGELKPKMAASIREIRDVFMHGCILQPKTPQIFCEQGGCEVCDEILAEDYTLHKWALGYLSTKAPTQYRNLDHLS
jgi:hypothetical protein